MLHYPKMPSSEGCPGGRCVAFEKIDGTNLHFDWERELGWHAFGTRRDSFDLDERGIAAFHAAHPGLEQCVELFQGHLASVLAEIFANHERYAGFPGLKAFAEYAGPHSFEGQHRSGDEMELILFDVQAEGYGFIGPEEFVADFGQVGIPRVLYRGKFTGKLTDDIRKGKLCQGEGAVIKGGKGGEDLWMCKIKTDVYRERLQRVFATRWKDYWE